MNALSSHSQHLFIYLEKFVFDIFLQWLKVQVLAIHETISQSMLPLNFNQSLNFAFSCFLPLVCLFLPDRTSNFVILFS